MLQKRPCARVHGRVCVIHALDSTMGVQVFGSWFGRLGWGWYDGAIMMARTQITLEPETQRRARRRASELGVSFAEYVRSLVARDLDGPRTQGDVTRVFDLGSSGGSSIRREKDAMIAEAFEAERLRARR